MVALFELGTVAVHQATYLLAGAGVHAASLEHRHGYLEQLAPVLVAAALAAIAVSIVASAVRRRLPVSFEPGCTTERAALYAFGLIAVYLSQELAEGLFEGGQPAVLAGAVNGGWLAMPIAIAVGALAAIVGGWLDRAEAGVAAAFHQPMPRPPRRTPRPVLVPRRALITRPLAFGLSPRPPPAPLAG